jgi:hypothetical protein
LHPPQAAQTAPLPSIRHLPSSPFNAAPAPARLPDTPIAPSRSTSLQPIDSLLRSETALSRMAVSNDGAEAADSRQLERGGFSGSFRRMMSRLGSGLGSQGSREVALEQQAQLAALQQVVLQKAAAAQDAPPSGALRQLQALQLQHHQQLEGQGIRYLDSSQLHKVEQDQQQQLAPHKLPLPPSHAQFVVSKHSHKLAHAQAAMEQLACEQAVADSMQHIKAGSARSTPKHLEGLVLLRSAGGEDSETLMDLIIGDQEQAHSTPPCPETPQQDSTPQCPETPPQHAQLGEQSQRERRQQADFERRQQQEERRRERERLRALAREEDLARVHQAVLNWDLGAPDVPAVSTSATVLRRFTSAELLPTILAVDADPIASANVSGALPQLSGALKRTYSNEAQFPTSKTELHPFFRSHSRSLHSLPDVLAPVVVNPDRLVVSSSEEGSEL